MFFKKKNSSSFDFSKLGADMHSHLLPGIDDGSSDMETSLKLIKGMKELGYKKLITTPHIMWDMYQNTAELILKKLEEVKNKLKEEQIDIDLQAAAEYFIDDHLAELLKQKESLLTFGNKLVLVEFSMASQPFDLKDVLFEMQIQGYQPVIAHPERYAYLDQNKRFYSELKDAGLFFQLNILSLSGYYGTPVFELARYLAKNQYYDLVGTDLHHLRHLEALKNPSLFSSLQRILESGKIQNQEL
ncbi:MAG TPA: CpsB/CapC family capsule biosynthesis tyrosine phosphatase [Chitinophagaceae bacterium]|jgi:tyrosine-protein phosphatase YwqE|nr:CpsB/CapC family capsule biosynthesis tyrosine phosphatase [Chitinophagaceae bacterium]